MWGVAQYFAVNASYSHGYSYSVPNTNHRQMFYVRVLIGDAINLKPDGALRKPPPKQSSGGDNLVVYYDSVTGETGNSQVPRSSFLLLLFYYFYFFIFLHRSNF
jgi:hypothetical protein